MAKTPTPTGSAPAGTNDTATTDQTVTNGAAGGGEDNQQGDGSDDQDGDAGDGNSGGAPDGPVVEVRVLIHHGDHRPNQVIELPADQVTTAAQEGWADPNPEAVAYAKSLIEG